MLVTLYYNDRAAAFQSFHRAFQQSGFTRTGGTDYVQCKTFPFVPVVQIEQGGTAVCREYFLFYLRPFVAVAVFDAFSVHFVMARGV